MTICSISSVLSTKSTVPFSFRFPTFSTRKSKANFYLRAETSFSISWTTKNYFKSDYCSMVKFSSETTRSKLKTLPKAKRNAIYSSWTEGMRKSCSNCGPQRNPKTNSVKIEHLCKTYSQMLSRTSKCCSSLIIAKLGVVMAMWCSSFIFLISL